MSGGGKDEELAAPRVVPRRPAGAGQAREDDRDVAVRLAGSSGRTNVGLAELCSGMLSIVFQMPRRVDIEKLGFPKRTLNLL